MLKAVENRIINLINRFLIFIFGYSVIVDFYLRILLEKNDRLLFFIEIQRIIYWPLCGLVFVILFIGLLFQTNKNHLKEERYFRIHRRDLLYFMGVIIIFILAFLIRVYKLQAAPVNYDEAFEFLRSAQNPNFITKYAYIPVTALSGYIQIFFVYLVYLAGKFFHHPACMVRIPSVIIGTATVVLTYKLTYQMYGRMAGLLSSLFMCFLPWHIIHSRIGMSAILMPFSGCLIFYTLYNSIIQKSIWNFLLACLFLGLGSLYTYQVSLLFIPIFFTILVCLRKHFNWVSLKVILCGVLIFFLFFYPLLYLQIIERDIDFLDNLYRPYHINVFSKGFFLSNILKNLTENTKLGMGNLFFSCHKGPLLYARSLKSALLLGAPIFFLLLVSTVFALSRRRISDKMILIWMGTGLFMVFAFGGCSFKNCMEARYLLIILPIPLILIARFINSFFFKQRNKNSLISKIKVWLLIIGVFICMDIVAIELLQIIDYFITDSISIEARKENSFGCAKAAEFFRHVPNGGNSIIISDIRMYPIITYLRYYFFNKDKNISLYLLESKNKKEMLPKKTYYVIWAPESHKTNYWGGVFRNLYNIFSQKYPYQLPIKTIYYPNGQAAIFIFEIKEKGGNFISYLREKIDVWMIKIWTLNDVFTYKI